MKKGIIISIGIGIVVILAAVAIVYDTKNNTPETPVQAVQVIDGKQVIAIRAKAGFTPRTIVATAGMPTTLRVTTKGTFDCSSSIRIPSLDVSKILPQTGTTDIDIGTPSKGLLQGSCGMGMYPFEIDFQ
jgi:plastocyanin domain-containing protein